MIIAVALIVFIAINRTQTEVSFLFFTVTMSLWIALTIAAVGGLIAGFLIGRKRYKPQGRRLSRMAPGDSSRATRVCVCPRLPKQTPATCSPAGA